MVGIPLVEFVWLNLQFSVSWLVDFQGVRVAQSLVFCVMVGRILVGFVRLNLQSSVSWLVDFSGVRVAQSLVFCVMVGRLLVGFVRLNLQFSVSSVATFSGVRVAQSLVFCLMVGRLSVGFVWLNLQFSGSRLATFSGVRVAQSLLFCLMVGRLLVGSCGSIFRFLYHDWWTFSVVRVAQSFVFCVMVGRLSVGIVCLNLQFSVSWLVDFQWGSCGSIFIFLRHDWQTFSGLRVSQSLVFCVMVGILLVEFLWLNLQFSVSWLVDFQWGSCGFIFSFLCYGRQTFSQVRVALFLDFCVMLGRLLVVFVCLNHKFSV